MGIALIAVLQTPLCGDCVYHDPTTGPRPCSLDDNEFIQELLLDEEKIFCGSFVQKAEL